MPIKESLIACATAGFMCICFCMIGYMIGYNRGMEKISADYKKDHIQLEKSI